MSIFGVDIYVFESKCSKIYETSMYSHSVFLNYCSICHIIASEEMLIRFEIALNFKLTRPAAAMCCCIFEYLVRIEIFDDKFPRGDNLPQTVTCVIICGL